MSKYIHHGIVEAVQFTGGNKESEISDLIEQYVSYRIRQVLPQV